MIGFAKQTDIVFVVLWTESTFHLMMVSADLLFWLALKDS